MITLKKNGDFVDEYTPSYSGQHIVIAIDSSKSNTAMFVSTAKGRVLDDYEISGAGEDTDVYDLCKYTRKQLKSLFYEADILFVGIEDIITKKETKDGKESYGGVDIHTSRQKITAVFDNFMFLFEEYFNIRPTPINNWLWKSTILPNDYRTRNHKKGSKDWLKDLGSPYGLRKDDVTDAYCILQFIIKTYKFNVKEVVETTCPTNKKYIYTIFPENVDLPGSKWYEIKNNDTLMHNITAVADRCSEDEVALFKWPIANIPLDVIYSDKLSILGNHVFTRKDKNVVVCVGVN